MRLTTSAHETCFAYFQNLFYIFLKGWLQKLQPILSQDTSLLSAQSEEIAHSEIFVKVYKARTKCETHKVRQAPDNGATGHSNQS